MLGNTKFYSFNSRVLFYILRDLKTLKQKSKVESENISSGNKKIVPVTFQSTIYLQKKTQTF